MYNIICLCRQSKLTLINIFVVEKTMLISRAVYTDVSPNYSVFACELMTLDFDVGLIPMIKC